MRRWDGWWNSAVSLDGGVCVVGQFFFYMNRRIKCFTWTIICLGFCAFGIAICSAQTDPRTSAVAAWYFGDGITGETNSISSTGTVSYNVTPTGRGARPARRTAQLTSAYFNAGTSLGISSNRLTVFLRARVSSGTWNSGLFAKRGSVSTLNYNLFAADLPGTTGNDIGFELRTSNASVQVSFPVSRIDATAWHNLVGRYDGTNVQLFCDDRLMASAPLTGNLALNTEPTLIGAETDSGSIVRRFTGFLEEAALWNVALTDAQLAYLNNLTAIHEAYPTNLLHYRHPDHDIGDVHIKSVGGGRWDLTYQYNLSNTYYQARLSTYDFLNFDWSNPVHAPVGGTDVLPTWFAIESFWDPFQNKWRSVWGYYGMRSSLSSDRFNWYAPSPQLLFQEPPNYLRFSDPSVTLVGSNLWQMAITTARTNISTGGAVGYATSSNLTQWTFRGDLYFPGNRGAPEVPSVFKMGAKWYLLTSWYNNAVGRPSYAVADSPTGPWSEFTPNSLDGKDVCAATSDTDGTQRLLLGWIPLYAWNNSNQNWGGHLCFPREIFQIAGGVLRSRLPAQFTQKIRGPQIFPGLATPSTKSGSWTYQGTTINSLSTSGQNRAILPGLFDRFDADMTFTNNTGTSRVGWLLNWQESGSYFEVGLDQASQSLFIRTAGGTIHADLSVPFALNTQHRLRVIVEQDMVEVIYDDQFTLASRIPSKLLTTSIGLFSDSGPVNFSSVTVHRLKNLEAIPTKLTVNVPGDQPNILAALNVPGVTDILIAPGIYTETNMLSVSTAMTLTAAGGPVTIRVPSDQEAAVQVASGVTGAVFDGIKFERPSANDSGMQAVQLLRAASAAFTNCIFTGPGNGFGAKLISGADATFDNCVFSNFSAAASGAAAIFLEGHDTGSPYSDLTVRNCVFDTGCNGWIRTIETANWARIGQVTVTNCLFKAARTAQALKFRDGGGLVMTYDPTKVLLFEDCTFEGTTLEVAEFHYTSGGGPAGLTFSRCLFKAYNSTRKMFWFDLPTPIKFENCLFAGGQHQTIMTIWGGPPSVDFYHCTMINDGYGGQSSFINGWDGGRTFDIVNCLFRCPVNYTAGFVGDAGSSANRNYSVSHSVIDHPTPTGTKAQITAGPGYSNTSLASAFVNAASRDYHLVSGSPWVGGGIDLGYTLDLDKNTRNQGGAPDMGAYKFQIAPVLPAVSVANNAGNVVVTFTGVLQSAGQVQGPFTDVSGATSPLTMAPTNTNLFWRSRSP